MPRRSIVPCLVLLLIAAGLPLMAAPAAEFAFTTHDAGQVQLGSDFDVVFTFKNTGDEPVQITGVRPQCGCTVADYTPLVEPGGEGRIVAHMKTGSLQSGKTSKTITVNTTAPDAQRVILNIKMDLVTPLEFLPRNQLYLRAAPGEEKIDRVLARPHGEGMKITAVASSNPVVTVSLEKPELDAGNEASAIFAPREGDSWIVVRLRPDAPAGVHRADVKVSTTDPEFPEATVKVSAVVR